MQYFYPIILLFSSVLLLSCAHSPMKDKKNYEITRNLTVPGNSPLTNTEDYYPIPKTNLNSDPSSPVPAPSLVPPGSISSHINQSNNINSSRYTYPGNRDHLKETVALKETNGRLSFQISKPMSPAWTAVGTALKKTNYRILDQDVSMHAYYILDMEKTGNKLTQVTPIYQVYLKSNNAYTEVMLCKNNHCAHNQISLPTQKRILTEIKNQLLE